MNFTKYDGYGYVPSYTRTSLIDDLHTKFGFNTAKEIIPIKKMKNICADTKNVKYNVKHEIYKKSCELHSYAVYKTFSFI